MSVGRNGSMVRRRILGRRLRVLREESRQTMDAAAPLLDWSVSKLSRIENGQQAIDVHGVRSMLDLYGAGGDEWTELIALVREARQPGWWQPYDIGDDSYIGFEAEAVRVQTFALDPVPGLLQTAEYSRAVFASAHVERTAEQLADAVAVRTIRQQRLSSADDPLELVAVIDESVLHRATGGPDVLLGQLIHLADLAELESVTLQVLPARATGRSARSSGFSVLNFGELGEPDLVYVEHVFGALQIEKEAEVASARLTIDRLRSEALSPTDSLALIREVAERT